MTPFAPGVRRIENVRIAMRDGIELEADIYLPDGDGPFPALLERTPYGRRLTNHADATLAHPEPRSKPEMAADFARAGFAFVIQDCRGRYGSAGTFTKYLNEGPDGVDTLAWMATQPWCDGRIGTLGFSYGAHAQTALAIEGAPGLSAMFIDSGGFSSAYHGGIRQGGAYELKQLTWALKHARLAYAADPDASAALAAVDIRDWVRVAPWRKGCSPLAAAPDYETFIADQWANETFSDFWRAPALYARGHYDRFPDVPVVLVSSWYDPYAATAAENWQGLAARKRSPVKLILGPWTHGQRSATYAGDVDFGRAATLDGNLAPDNTALRLAWFRRHLTGAGDDPLPAPVNIFVMGGGSGRRRPDGRLDHGGRWIGCDAWPPRDAVETRLFLTRTGGMSFAPDAVPGIRAFRADPADPVPTVGGAIASGLPLMQAGAFDQRAANALFPAGSADTPLAARDDYLVFETPPLDAPLEVVGPVEADIWVSTSTPDADLALKLVDVHPPTADDPDGFAMNLCHGILRLRFRDGFEQARTMTPGEIARVTVRLFPTANRFAAGHRLRLDIAGSNFPHFDVNPNSGAPAGEPSRPQVAETTIHSGGDRPSCLRIFVRPAA